jgi:hypothetical protein
MLCYRGLGQPENAEWEQKLFLRFKGDESAQALTGRPRPPERYALTTLIFVPGVGQAIRLPSTVLVSAGQACRTLKPRTIMSAKPSTTTFLTLPLNTVLPLPLRSGAGLKSRGSSASFVRRWAKHAGGRSNLQFIR